MTVGEKLSRITEIMNKANAILDHKGKYLFDEVRDFFNDDIHEVIQLLDELEYDLRDYFPTRYTLPHQETYSELKEHDKLYLDWGSEG